MRRHQKSHCFCEAEDKGQPVPALTIPFPFLFPVPALTILFPFLFPVSALTNLFPVNKFPYKLPPKVPNKTLKNPPFCSFVSFLIVLVNILF